MEELTFFVTDVISKAMLRYFMLKQSYTYLKTMPNWIFQAQKHTVQSNQM